MIVETELEFKEKECLLFGAPHCKALGVVEIICDDRGAVVFGVGHCCSLRSMLKRVNS